MADSIPLFKLVIVGLETVGKSSILESYRNKQFTPQYRSSDQAKQVNIRVEPQGISSKVDLTVFDLPGREMHMGLNRMYLRDTNAALIVYDKTNRLSLESAEQWIYELEQTGPSDLLIMLAGNKLDLTQQCQLTHQDGANFAKNHKISVFIECSAKTKDNLDTLFNKIALECYNQRHQFEQVVERKTFRLGTTVNRGQDIASAVEEKQKGGCC